MSSSTTSSIPAATPKTRKAHVAPAALVATVAIDFTVAAAIIFPAARYLDIPVPI